MSLQTQTRHYFQYLMREAEDRLMNIHTPQTHTHTETHTTALTKTAQRIHHHLVIITFSLFYLIIVLPHLAGNNILTFRPTVIDGQSLFL